MSQADLTLPTDRAGTAVAWLLWLLIAVLWAYPIIRDVVQRRFDLFELRNVFLGHYGLQFVVWPFAVLVTGKTQWHIAVDRHFEIGLLMALSGLASFLIGYYSRLPHIVGRRLPRFSSSWNDLRMKVVVAVCLILGLGGFYSLMVQVGGVQAYLADMETFRETGLVGKGYLVELSTFLLSLPALILYGRGGSKRFLAVAVVIFCLSLIPAGILGFRMLIFFPILQVLIVRHNLFQRLSLKTAGILFSGLFVFFALFAIWRAANTPADKLIFDRPSTMKVALFQLLGRSYGSEVLAIMSRAIAEKDVPLAWGRDSAVEVATYIIPRVWYPGKNRGISFRFAETFFRPYLPPDRLSGVSPTILGELYWNFGWLGIVPGMWISGVLCRTAYVWIQRDRNRSNVMVYSMLGSFAFLAVEAPTVATESFWPRVLLLVLLLWWISASRKVEQRERS